MTVYPNRDTTSTSGGFKNTIVVYTADRWEHVCPVVRVTGPAEMAGFRVVKGNEWQEDGSYMVFPERVAEAGVVVVQRDFPIHTEAYDQVMNEARRLGKPVVYELDDLLPELPEEHPDVLHYIPARTAIIRAIVEADAVVGSTPALRDYLHAFNPNAWVTPNYLNDRLWSLRPPSTAEEPPVKIGYLGGHSHSYDLDLITPTLLRIMQRYGDDVLFKFWGAAPPPMVRECPNVEWVNLGLVDYGEFARYFEQLDCDIFIAPLQDNLFNQCKSFIKFLEYSSIGVPGVYSRVTPYASVVEHGVNGFLANTPEEWETHLAQLIQDPDLRLRIGTQAQETVRRRWLLSEHIEAWEAVYRQFFDLHERLPKNDAEINVARKMHYWQKDLEKRVAEQGKALRDLTYQAGSLKEQVAERDLAYQTAYNLYLDIMNSNGWKLMQTLFKVRVKLIPEGSRREKAVKAAVYALGVLRREGPVAFLRGTARTARAAMSGDSQGGVASAGEPRAAFTTSMVDGMRYPDPHLSVVLLAEDDAVDEQKLRAWLDRQTISSVEAVRWDATAGVAYRLETQDPPWAAADVKSLCSGLNGRYVCLASVDLLQQSETYLEANLTALETEALAFTVNLRGRADWAIQRLQAGALPGSSSLPLLRQVAAKEALQNDFSLDLSASADKIQGFPTAVGKILVHTSNHYDVEHVLPFEGQLPAGDRLLDGRTLLMRTNGQLPWRAGAQMLHPVESVLPDAPVDDGMPTVVMLIQFLAVGGAERLALNLIRSLQGQVRFVVVALEDLAPHLGTTADEFRTLTPYVYTLPDFLHPDLNLSFISAVVERFTPDSIYIANGSTWIYDNLPALKRRFPDVKTINQVYDHQAGWINRYDVATVMYLDAHISANPKISEAYVQRGVQPDQVCFIEHGIDPGDVDPADYPETKRFAVKKQLGLPHDKKIVTFAARLHPQKRPMDFVELARRFAAEPEVIFLMVGDGPLTGQVEAEIARIGLKNLYRQKFYRPISDVYAITDVMVLPSEHEAMPLVIAETLAMGRPVVATDVGNNREVIEMSRGGVVVPQVGDVAGLMAGVQKMLADPPDPAYMRTAILDRFGIHLIAGQYRELLIRRPRA